MKRIFQTKRIRILVILAFLLTVGPISWIVYGENEKEISYTVEEEIKEEGRKAELRIEIIASSKVEEITKIELPDGSIKDNQKKITYEVEENGEYRFIVYYKTIDENGEGEVIEIEKKEVITYQESNIQREEAESIVDIEEISNNNPIVYAMGDVEINEINFPDDNFRNYLLTDTSPNQIKGYGTDKVLTADEIADIFYINVSAQKVTKLDGVEYFTALTSLNCAGNQLIELNISQNINLTRLDCYNNKLSTLDISNNRFLTRLECYYNPLTSLNISQNKMLKELLCHNNKLTSLNVSQNKALTIIECHNNKLTSLDVRENTNLSTLKCHGNQILSLDLSKNIALSVASFEGQIRDIPMSFADKDWVSNQTIHYSITNKDNENINYNSLLGQFASSSIKNTSSSFSTNCIDGSGNARIVRGTLNFKYDMVPVDNISGISESMYAGTTITLNGNIEPTNATTVKTITWTIKDAGTTGATLLDNTLKTDRAGIITVIASIDKATVLESTYTKEFKIFVSYTNPNSLICTIEGTKGKNDWYIGDVIVKPPSGYELSKTLGSGYTSSLLYTSSTTPTVYLKETSTGALYSVKTLNAIRIDKVDPKITGITDAGSAIATSKTVTVTDDNLSSVLLYSADSLAELSSATGVSQTVSSGSSSITLTASTKDQYFKVEAEDASGRKTVYTYTLIAPSYGVEVQDVIFNPVNKGYGSIAGIKLNIDVDIGNTSATIASIVSSDTSQFTVSGSGVNWTVTPVTGLVAGKHQVTLTITYDGGRTTTNTVSMVVKETDPYVLIAIPSDTEMERVKNDAMFEARKEMEVSIATGVDKSLYPGNFYIKTEPRFYLFNTIDNDEWFSVQVYDRNENKHNTKSTPIAVLNKDHTSEKFYIKALKDIARDRGIYKGTMTFDITYEVST